MDEQLRLLLDNDEFVAELFTKEEPEDVQKLFSDNGVELTIDEVKTLGRELGKAYGENGALSEDDLEGIAGGSSFTPLVDGILTEMKRKLITQTRRRIIKFSRLW